MKFIILLRHFDVADPKEQFKIEHLEAKDRDTAWEIVENNLINSNTQAWIMTDKELEALKDLLSQETGHFKQYMADYVNEELDKGNVVVAETINSAYEAYKSIYLGK